MIENIAEECYKVTLKRGCINANTSFCDFMDKLKEEVFELECEGIDGKNRNLELADIVLVCFNIAKHYNIDLMQEMKNKVELDKNRA